MLRMSISLCLRSNRHYLLGPAELGGGEGLGELRLSKFQAENKKLNNESSLSELQDFKISYGRILLDSLPGWRLRSSLVTTPNSKYAPPSLLIQPRSGSLCTGSMRGGFFRSE